MIRIFLALVAMIVCTVSARADDPLKIPKSVLEAGWKKAECTVPLDDERRDGADLGGGLELVEIYCWRAAYQAGSIFFVVDPKAPSKARLLQFPTFAGKGKPLGRTYSLTSADYDAGKKRLSMAHKGRGAGDCGETGTWQWKGKDFALTGFWSKPNCDDKPFDEGRRWQVYPPRR